MNERVAPDAVWEARSYGDESLEVRLHYRSPPPRCR